jgi:hypothetical protein
MASAEPKSLDPKLNPLGEEERTKLNQAKQSLGDVVKVIEAAEQCGTECQHFRTIVEMLGSRIDAMEKVYFKQP